MKKLLFLTAIGSMVLLLSNCGTAKKAVAPKMNYTTNIQPLVMANCSPCHIPAKGGNKHPYDNYANLKTDIDEIIKRIELQPGQKGFMPFKGKRLSDSTINVIKQWKTDGLLEN